MGPAVHSGPQERWEPGSGAPCRVTRSKWPIEQGALATPLPQTICIKAVICRSNETPEHNSGAVHCSPPCPPMNWQRAAFPGKVNSTLGGPASGSRPLPSARVSPSGQPRMGLLLVNRKLATNTGLNGAGRIVGRVTKRPLKSRKTSPMSPSPVDRCRAQNLGVPYTGQRPNVLAMMCSFSRSTRPHRGQVAGGIRLRINISSPGRPAVFSTTAVQSLRVATDSGLLRPLGCHFRVATSGKPSTIGVVEGICRFRPAHRDQEENSHA